MRIVDTRRIAHQQTWTTNALEAEVYCICDSAQTLGGLLKQISTRHDADVSAEDVMAAVQTLCDTKVLLRLNGKLISLGVADSKHPTPGMLLD